MNKFIIAGGVFLLLVIIGVLLYFFVFKKKPKKLTGQTEASVNAQLAEPYDISRHDLVIITIRLRFTDEHDISILDENPSDISHIGLRVNVNDLVERPTTAITTVDDDRVLDFTFSLRAMTSDEITLNNSFVFTAYFITEGETDKESLNLTNDIVLDGSVQDWINVVNALNSIDRLQDVLEGGLELIPFSGQVQDSSISMSIDQLQSGQYILQSLLADNYRYDIEITNIDTVNKTVDIMFSDESITDLLGVTLVKEDATEYFLIKKSDDTYYVWIDNGSITEKSNQLLLVRPNAHFKLFNKLNNNEIIFTSQTV